MRKRMDRIDCKDVHPGLSRVAEGEATPGEAMRTARHLSDCTACRILLARERRLARMLEDGLDDPLQVGEEFVQSVMANLPREPPARIRAAAKTRRDRKLLRAARIVASR
jgi:predicted anti-sigma-YlaC factor YlaD